MLIFKENLLEATKKILDLGGGSFSRKTLNIKPELWWNGLDILVIK